MIDLATILIAATAIAAVVGGVTFFLRLALPEHSGGVGALGVAQFSIGFAYLFLLLRNVLPEAPALLAHNAATILAIVLMGNGIGRLLDRPMPAAYAPVMVTLYLSGIAWFLFVQKDFVVRVALFTLVAMVGYLLPARVVWLHWRKTKGPGLPPLLIAILVLFVVTVARGIDVMLRRNAAGYDSLLSQILFLGAVLGQIILGVTVIILVSEGMRAKWEALASHDSLTGLFNRRMGLSEAQRELARCLAQGKSLALAVADLDHFKKVNDRFGHLVGDDVLVAVARRLRGCLRDSDLFWRHGGEEFCILLPETDIEGARLVFERLRMAVSSESVATRSETVAATASFGVTIATPGCGGDIDRLLASADSALYRAKETRDTVVLEECGH